SDKSQHVSPHHFSCYVPMYWTVNKILPVFFSNCLFLALYDSVILLKHVALLLSRSKSTRGEWRRMLTSEGLRCVWKSFLLDAYKQ
ncbi:hypothetical protein A6R68_24165, partial [Neotoma lepida]